MSNRIAVLRKARLSYPHLFEKSAFNEKAEPKYSARFLISKKDTATIAAVEQAILNAAKDTFGAKADSILRGIRDDHKAFAFQDGDHPRYEGQEGCAGHWILNAKSKTRPSVVDRDGTTPVTESDNIIFGGCYVNASVEAFAYSNDSKGVSFNLRAVAFNSKGDAFGGGSPVTESDLRDLASPDEDLLAGDLA